MLSDLSLSDLHDLMLSAAYVVAVAFGFRLLFDLILNRR